MKETLHDEKKRLLARLLHLNVQSPGRDRIIQRLEAIDEELKQAARSAVGAS